MQTGIGGAAGDACDPLRKYLPNPDLGPHDPTTAVQLGALVLIKDKGAPTGQPINTYFPYARAYNGTGRAADAYAARVIADTDSYQGSGQTTFVGLGFLDASPAAQRRTLQSRPETTASPTLPRRRPARVLGTPGEAAPPWQLAVDRCAQGRARETQSAARCDWLTATRATIHPEQNLRPAATITSARNRGGLARNVPA